MGFNSSLHGLRGVASAMVFLAHLIDGFARHFFPGSALAQTVSPMLGNALVFGVEMFFLISGYVIAGSCMKYSLREFAARRFLRLYPVFLFFTLLYFAANAVIGHEPHKQSVGYLLANLSFLDLWLGTPKLTPNAWSISCEVWYYAFTYVGIALFIRGAMTHRTEVAILYVVAVLLLIVFAPITIYFVIGVGAYLFRERTAAAGRYPAWAELAMLAALAALAAAFERSSHLYTPADLLQPAQLAMLALATLLFVQITRGRSVFDRVLQSPLAAYLGTISYSLYLAHPYTYFAVRKALEAAGLADLPMAIAFALYMGIMLPAGLAFAHLVHITLEVQPYRRVFGSAVYGETHRPARGASSPMPS